MKSKDTVKTSILRLTTVLGRAFKCHFMFYPYLRKFSNLIYFSNWVFSHHLVLIPPPKILSDQGFTLRCRSLTFGFLPQRQAHRRLYGSGLEIKGQSYKGGRVETNRESTQLSNGKKNRLFGVCRGFYCPVRYVGIVINPFFSWLSWKGGKSLET